MCYELKMHAAIFVKVIYWLVNAAEKMYKFGGAILQ